MNFHLAKSYVKHLFKAKNEHSIHSPFVFEFYNECLKSKSQFYQFENIEKERKKLLSSDKSIEILELGAGSKVNQSKSRLIKDIVKNSLKQPFLAQQLFRIVNYLKPKEIIEIGTSLGITTSYLASIDPKTTVNTLEGCPNTSEVAKRTFNALQLNNIKQIEGDFNKTLAPLVMNNESIELIYFDGNHTYESTIEYFNICKENYTENTCFIFDDIYWSKGMTKAWDEICNNQDVLVSIDTFYFGICFFRKNQPKQHFILR